MAKRASLPFKGNFNHTQSLGARPSVYAKYGLAGHDGDDWTMPEGTPLYAPFTGKVINHGNDEGGWGKYVQIWDPSQNLVVNIAHTSGLQVITGASVRGGQQIGFSGNTGFSEAPHVHVAVADTDSSGNRINQNNGFKGWYSILDSGRIQLVDLGLWGVTSDTTSGDSGTSGTPGTSGSGATPAVSFDTIFSKYYAGWGREAAEQDFRNTYGSDEQRLRVARGLADEGKKKVVKKRPELLNKQYPLNPHFSGMSLKQIADSGIPMGRVDILAGFLGIPLEQKLQAGQLLSLSGFPTDYYPDSSEWLAVKLLTSKGTIGNKGEYYIKPEFAGMTLKDIRNKTNLPFRTDILGAWLGIGDATPILADEGLGTQGFPNINDTGSGEVQGFFQLFTKEAPASVQGIPEDNQAEDTGLDESVPSTQGATIFVQSIPERARIFIDGLYMHDLTPSNNPEPTYPGSHVVRVEKTGYTPFEQTIEVKENEQKVIKAVLKRSASGGDAAPAQQYQPSPIAIEAIIARIDQIERILTEMGRL